MAGPFLALTVVGVNVATGVLGWPRFEQVWTSGGLGLLIVVSVFWSGLWSGLAVAVIGLGYLTTTHLIPWDRAQITEYVGIAAVYLSALVVVHKMLGQRSRAERLAAECELLARQQQDLEALVAARTAELVESQRQLAARNAELAELDRMKNDFVSAVSHDLRTPLTAIKGYVEFLEDGIGGPLTEAQVEFVGHLHAGTSRLERLVDDLLDFARLEAGQFKLAMEETNLACLTRRVVGLLQPLAAERQLVLELAEAPADLELRLDPSRIEQVLINLVGNALKFTPEGGRVTVRVSTGGGLARVAVTDTGRGIPAEAMSRLFERFYQVHSDVLRAKGGIGLGLTIAKALVEAHGGRIEVESEENSGSTFWFELPLVGESRVLPAAAALDASLLH
jgi:signal transduction histidine kinase